jgi:Beta-galactosidase
MRNRLHGMLRATRTAVVLLGAVATGVLALASTGALADATAVTPTEIADYSGLYIATSPLIDSRRSPPPEVYEIDEVDGIYMRLVWSAIEPAPGAYDWSTLDRELDRPLRAGKKVSLSVITGGYAPDWLAGRGVSHSTFVVRTSGGRKGCRPIQIGWPWDQD